MDSINSLKDRIIKMLSQQLTDITVTDEFYDGELYSPLKKPVISVYLKNAEQKGVALGRESYENAMPQYGCIADITIGFKLFYGKDISAMKELSARLASALIFDDSIDTQSFSCKKIGYNQSFELAEQECEAHFTLIFSNGGHNHGTSK